MAAKNRREPEKKNSLTHQDQRGRAKMVDVSAKPSSTRRARARAVISLTPEIREKLFAGELPKGEAFAVARLAGILAAKETWRLIPLCHQVPLSSVEVSLSAYGECDLEIIAEVRCQAATGVEMEALTAVSLAALTIYDMCKAMHKGMRIGPIELLEKSGGRSGEWRREAGE